MCMDNTVFLQFIYFGGVLTSSASIPEHAAPPPLGD